MALLRGGPAARKGPLPRNVAIPRTVPASPRQHVAFWPSSVDMADENWRRQRLAGEEMGRHYRSNVAQRWAETEAVGTTLASELRACEAELWHARRSVQGLWASRRILVDEVRSLREKLEERDSIVHQQTVRVATLERELERQTALRGAWRAELTVEPPSEAAPAPPRPARGHREPPRSAPSHRDTEELEAKIESELASTRAELMGLLGRASGEASSLASGVAGYRAPTPPPPLERLSPLRWGLPASNAPDSSCALGRPRINTPMTTCTVPSASYSM